MFGVKGSRWEVEQQDLKSATLGLPRNMGLLRAFPQSHEQACELGLFRAWTLMNMPLTPRALETVNTDATNMVHFSGDTVDLPVSGNF